MPSWKTAFGSYLKAEDILKPRRAVIESVEFEEIKNDDKTEKKLVARLVGQDKGLVLNKTKAEAIEHICGSDDYEQWAGTVIVLAPGTTKYQGKTVACIDIKRPAATPAATQAAARPPVVPAAVMTPSELPDEPITDDDIPF